MKQYFIILLLLAASCTRRDLSDTECSSAGAQSATFTVSVDWSLSGFDLDEMSRSSDDFIHRVTFRFFPTDGSAPFDRYLEDNVESGQIEIPEGSYSVIIFNESIYDSYWEEAIEFENTDSYELFAAKIVDNDPSLYSFYTPSDGENMSVEALKLASTSVAEFTVCSVMCATLVEEWSQEQLAMASRLQGLTPRPLTCPTTVSIDTQYLSSAATVSASLSGLSRRVFMATGQTDTLTTTHIGEITQISWHDDSEQLHGVISESFLTFSVPPTVSTHTLTLDVILVSGERHSPEQEMIYDVSDQILESATRYADNDLEASVTLTLPDVSGDVEVEAWGDENVVTIQ